MSTATSAQVTHHRGSAACPASLPTGASPARLLALVPLTRKYFSKRTLEVLKVPMVSISITVLKALKDRALAGHRKFPAAPEEQAARDTVRTGPRETRWFQDTSARGVVSDRLWVDWRAHANSSDEGINSFWHQVPSSARAGGCWCSGSRDGHVSQTGLCFL